MGKEQMAALLLYRQLFKSLGSQVSREQLKKYYQHTVAARSQGDSHQILKNLEVYLQAIKTQNQIMDAEHIGRPQDYKHNMQKAANFVGLGMPDRLYKE